MSEPFKIIEESELFNLLCQPDFVSMDIPLRIPLYGLCPYCMSERNMKDEYCYSCAATEVLPFIGFYRGIGIYLAA